jgi:hypothetical protein
VEIGVDKNTMVVVPAPLVSTIQELGRFLAKETAAATPKRLREATSEPTVGGRAVLGARLDGV